MNDLVSLSELFNKSIFRIPDYQRGYAWTETQLTDFWEDVINLNDKRNHYTGMLSLIELSEEVYDKWQEERWIINEKGYKAFHVVDGQQRLTTFIVFISCILDFAKRNNIQYINSEDIETIKESYIVEYKKPEKLLKAYKFGYEIDNPSFEFLRYKILGEKAPGDITETFYTHNLEIAQNFFNKNIANYFTEYGTNGLEEIFRKLVNRLQFNIHYIEEDSDVFVAFETMNNRGKKLSNLEILKNRLIYLTTIYEDTIINQDEKTQLRKDINDAWKEVYYQLGRNKSFPLNDDNYLKNHWTLFFKYSRNKGDDYIKFLLGEYFTPKAVYALSAETINSQQEYEELSDDENFDDDVEDEEIKFKGQLIPKNIKEYVDSLKSVAKYWYYSYNPKESTDMTDDEKEAISRLNRVGINYFRTLVVASFVNQNVTSAERVCLFNTIEKFIFVFFRMAKYQSTYHSAKCYQYARELLKGEIEISQIINELTDKFNNEKPEAISVFITKIDGLFKNHDGYYSWNDLKYFLFEYEQTLRRKTSVDKLSDWTAFTKNEKDHVSIEHIFPQTPTKWYWRNQFRDYQDETERHCLTNSLGNLLALSQSVNAALQNDEYYDKKSGNNKRERGYINGSNSEIEVANTYQEWNPKNILARGMNLLKYMQQRWNISFTDDEKYKVLGLEFMKENRQESPEIEKEAEIIRGKGNDDSSTSRETIEKYLESKEPVMVELYNMLFAQLQQRIEGLYESIPDSEVYIALRDDTLNQNISEIRIQKEQIRFNIHTPTDEKLRTGRPNRKSVNWSLEYNVYLTEEKEIPMILDAIIDSYNQML